MLSGESKNWGAERDKFPDGTDITTAFGAVTLSSLGHGRFSGLLDGKVYGQTADKSAK